MKIFELVGIVTVVGGVGGGLVLLIAWIKDYYIPGIIYRYRHKHRFDKPPTAKCYCRDCKRWNPDNGACDDHCNSRHMADSWFCCFAEPMTAKEEKSKRKVKQNEQS